MAAYLRPRRGTASGSTVVLKEGEIFLDTAKSSSATTLSSWGQIYVGNNTNNINALKPFVALPEAMVVNSGISASGGDSNIANGKSLATIFSAIKKLLSDHATSITNLNNDKVAKSGDTMTGDFILNRTNGSSDSYITFKANGTYTKYLKGGIFDTTTTTTIKLPSETGTLSTQEWILEYLSSKCYRKIGGVATSVTYTSTVGYQDINVSSLTGQNVIGILAVAGLGNRQRPVYSITNGGQTTFTISVSFVGLAAASSVQIYIYYIFDFAI